MKYINEVTRELDIEPHTLRNWEDKGYLGIVERDFIHGRMYEKEQLEKIKTIQNVVLKQREKGSKRTDFKEVERVLLEKFGGEVIERPQIIPATPEAFTSMLLKMEMQEKQIQELYQLTLDLANITKELPEAIAPALTKDQAEALLVHLEKQEKGKNEMEKEIQLLKEKLDLAVDFIQAREKPEKKSFWKRIFK